MTTEQQLLDAVKSKKLRLVCTARKRKLQRKGVDVFFIAELESWAWKTNW